MNDNFLADAKFNNELWELAQDNPAMQRAIIEAFGNKGDYMPTNTDAVSIFSPVCFPDQKDKLMDLLQRDSMKLSLNTLEIRLKELKQALTAKDSNGNELSEAEKFMQKLDITALGTMICASWIVNVYLPREGII